MPGSVRDKLNNYFNVDAFRTVPADTIGSTPRFLANYRGPNIVNEDVTLMKNFRITEPSTCSSGWRRTAPPTALSGERRTPLRRHQVRPDHQRGRGHGSCRWRRSSITRGILLISLKMEKGKCTRWVLMAGLTAGMCLTAMRQSLLQAYCIGCHNQNAKTAGVAPRSCGPCASGR